MTTRPMGCTEIMWPLIEPFLGVLTQREICRKFAITRSMLQHRLCIERGGRAPSRPRIWDDSERCAEASRLLAEGLSRRQTAERMGLKRQAVDYFARELYRGPAIFAAASPLWPADRWERAYAMFERGMSYRQIADEVGMTRNAVIGRFHRMLLSEMPKSTFKQRMDRLDSLAAPARGCCYPFGDPGKPDYRCCGEPTFEPNPEIRRRLCPEHHRLCWEKVPKRHAGCPGMAETRLRVVPGGLDKKRTSGA